MIVRIKNVRNQTTVFDILYPHSIMTVPAVINEIFTNFIVSSIN